jgi:CRISPR/Cas system-associated protein Csm6
VKITKNVLKRLIREELGALSESAGMAGVVGREQMENQLVPLVQQAIELVDRHVQDVDPTGQAKPNSRALIMLGHLQAVQDIINP